MEAEITNVITMATSRPNGRLPAKTYLTNLAAVLCRDPQLFMLAAANTSRVYPGSVNIILAPKKPTTPAPAPSTSTTTTTTTTTTSTTVEDKKKKKHSPLLKQVVNVLLNYLVEEPPTTTTTTSSPMKEGKKEEVASTAAAVVPPSAPGARSSVLFPPPSDSITSATVLQLLADLISAYPAITQVITRHTFTKNIKNSPNMIHFILREFIGSNPTIVPGNEPDYQSQQRASMANRVITSLCTRSEGKPSFPAKKN